MPMPTIAEVVNFYAGDDLTMPFVMKDATPAPINFTGWTWRSMWRAKPDSDVEITATVDATQGNVGRIVIHFSPAHTEQMIGNGFCDLEGTDASGTVRTPLRIPMTGTQDITR